MRFAANWYQIEFEIMPENPPPLPGARLEVRPFGIPPIEMREIWVAEVDCLEVILERILEMRVAMDISLSAYWSGPSIDDPGERLFGLALIDEYDLPPDPRETPTALGPLGDRSG